MTDDTLEMPAASLMMAQLQRRIARLLLRHDRQAFRGRFREFYAQSTHPQPDILRAYDRFIRLISLADELFEHILPRIRRQLSFRATRLEINEEPPLRGQVDWSETLRHSMTTYPDQPPMRFATTLRNRSFATPENRMVVAILLSYAQQLYQLRSSHLFGDAPLSTGEEREIVQLEERLRRELTTLHFQDIARDVKADEATDLVAQVSVRIRGGINPYGELIDWWYRIEQQHLRLHTHQQTGPVLQTQEQLGLSYQLWIALELANMLVEQKAFSKAEISADRLSFQFSWNDHLFRLVYDRTPTSHLVWKGAPSERPDYFITRADALVVRDEQQVYWQEPGVLLDAKCYLGEAASRASDAIKRLIADMQLVDATNGILLFPHTTHLSTSILPDTTRYFGAIAAESAIQLYALRPLEAEVDIHTTLAAILDQVSIWLPERPAIACHGWIPDRDTIRPGAAIRLPQCAYCPKPHISLTRVDIVDRMQDCLKNPRVCHIMSTQSNIAGLLPPFVQRVLNLDELRTAIDQLRSTISTTVAPTDTSEEAEQTRSAVITAIGQLVESYMAFQKPDTRHIEDKLRFVFGPFWSDATNKRGLPAEVQHMLVSGEYVYHEFDKIGIDDWAATAVQYTRAIEHQLKQRLYLHLGKPSPLKNKQGHVLHDHEFTFGTVSTAFNKRYTGDHNWATFVAQAVHPAGAKESELEAALKQIDGLRVLRNSIAHPEHVDQAKAQQVRDITIGEPDTSIPSMLRQLIEILDT